MKNDVNTLFATCLFDFFYNMAFCALLNEKFEF